MLIPNIQHTSNINENGMNRFCFLDFTISLKENTKYAVFSDNNIIKSYTIYVPHVRGELCFTIEELNEDYNLLEKSKEQYLVNEFFSPEQYNIPLRDFHFEDQDLTGLEYSYTIGMNKRYYHHVVVVEVNGKKLKFALTSDLEYYEKEDECFIQIVRSLRPNNQVDEIS